MFLLKFKKANTIEYTSEVRNQIEMDEKWCRQNKTNEEVKNH